MYSQQILHITYIGKFQELKTESTETYIQKLVENNLNRVYVTE